MHACNMSLKRTKQASLSEIWASPSTSSKRPKDSSSSSDDSDEQVEAQRSESQAKSQTDKSVLAHGDSTYTAR